MAHHDRFGRDKASQRRGKIRQPAILLPEPTALKRGDVVRWEGHEGVVQRITDGMAEINEQSATGRVWRLPFAMLSRQ